MDKIKKLKSKKLKGQDQKAKGTRLKRSKKLKGQVKKAKGTRSKKLKGQDQKS